MLTSSGTFRTALYGVLIGLAAGCAPAPAPPPAAPRLQAAEVVVNDTLVQYSLISALAAGDYSGGASLRKVLSEGDFGIGTFDRLDGELILIDGRMYQALADGRVRPADLEGRTPFAAVKFFREDGRIDSLSATTLEELDEQLERQLPRRNSPYALRIDGEFRELSLRSVPAQSPPFRTLVDVVKNQATWKHRGIRGTLIGLRCPSWIGTLNVSGYHWHFLSEDQQIGGHVLGCEFRNLSLRFDECTSVLIQLPTSEGFDEFRAEEIRKQDINDIERQRAEPGMR